MIAKDYLKSCKLVVREGEYSVCKTLSPPAQAAVILQTPEEITAIAHSGSINPALILAEEKGWKWVTFEAVLPFELVGFLALVSQVLAEAQVSIFALSAYSTDHLLIKKQQLPRALEQLVALGCTIKT